MKKENEKKPENKPELSPEQKQKILSKLEEYRNNFTGNDTKFSMSLGINKSQYSSIKGGKLDQVISDQKWIGIARRIGASIKEEVEWKTAETPFYKFMTDQLAYCQENSASRILCDVAGIGKTYTAEQYAKTHRNVAYVDCSQVKTKTELISFIAKSFGVSHTGHYKNVYGDLAAYLNFIPSPLVILDEAGDLKYEAFLELKALWNATKEKVGWYMTGADGLKEKMQKLVNDKKVGYPEIFDRYGKRYYKKTPDDAQGLKEFLFVNAAMVIKLNAPEEDIHKLIVKSDYSLRNVYGELTAKTATK